MTETIAAPSVAVPAAIPTLLLKWLSVCLLVGVELFHPYGPGWFTVQAVLSALALDNRRVLGIVNFGIAYNFIVLGLGPFFISVQDAGRVHEFGALLAAAILSGSLIARAMPRRPGAPDFGSLLAEQPDAWRRSVSLMKFAVAVQVTLLLVDLVRVGPFAYIRGATLSLALETYAAGGFQVLDILNFAASIFSLSALSVHVSMRSNAGRMPLHWRWMGVLVLLMPVLRLSRGQLMIGAITMLLVAGAGRNRTAPLRLTRVTALIAGLATVVTIVVGVGILRERAFATSARPLSTSTSDSSTVLLGELSPVIVVDAALNPAGPRYQGEGFFLPLLTRFVPRRLYDSKPENATTRFMKMYDPSSYAAGYSLASTAVGGLILNFGRVLTLLCGAVLAFWGTALIDRRRFVSPKAAGLISVIYANLYPLLRNDPANSLSGLILAIALYLLLRAATISSPRGSVR